MITTHSPLLFLLTSLALLAAATYYPLIEYSGITFFDWFGYSGELGFGPFRPHVQTKFSHATSVMVIFISSIRDESFLLHGLGIPGCGDFRCHDTNSNRGAQSNTAIPDLICEASVAELSFDVRRAQSQTLAGNVDHSNQWGAAWYPMSEHKLQGWSDVSDPVL
ncbi:hypothetical protein DFH06DRAFT_1137985 [Mycena polygramma]|nr:hypothetical protein DFH06DRAFT_1137985 [Mycena polygramma]